MPDIKGYLLFGPTYIKCPEQVNQKTQGKLVVPRGRRRVDREVGGGGWMGRGENLEYPHFLPDSS